MMNILIILFEMIKDLSDCLMEFYLNHRPDIASTQTDFNIEFARMSYSTLSPADSIDDENGEPIADYTYELGDRILSVDSLPGIVAVRVAGSTAFISSTQAEHFLTAFKMVVLQSRDPDLVANPEVEKLWLHYNALHPISRPTEQDNANEE